MKTIYARLGDLQLGETLEDGTTLGSIGEALDEVGVNIQTATGDLRDMGDVIEELMGKWQDLDTAQKQALAVKLAGKYQYNNLMALLENSKMYEENLEAAQTSLGTINQQQQIYLDSLEGKLNTLQATFEGFINSIFDVDDIKPFIDDITGLIKLLTGFTTSIGSTSIFSGVLGTGLRVFSQNFGDRALNKSQNRKARKRTQDSATLGTQLLAELDVDSSNLGENSATYAAAKTLGSKTKIMNEQQRGQSRQMLMQMVNLENDLLSKREKATSILDKMAIAYKNITGQAVELKINEDGQVENLDQALLILGDIKESFAAINEVSDDIAPNIGKINAEFNAIADGIGKNKNKGFNKQTQKRITNASYNLDTLIGTLSTDSRLLGTDGTNIMSSLPQYQALVAANTALGEAVSKMPTKPGSKVPKTVTKEVENAFNNSRQAVIDFIEALQKLENVDEKTAASIKQFLQEIGLQEGALKGMTEAVGDFKDSLTTKEVVSEVINLTGSIGQLIASVQSFRSIGSIWGNADLSGGEKLLQTIENLVFTAPMLASAVVNLGDQVELLIDDFKAKKRAVKQDSIVTAENTIVTDQNTEAQERNNLANKAGATGGISAGGTSSSSKGSKLGSATGKFGKIAGLVGRASGAIPGIGTAISIGAAALSIGGGVVGAAIDEQAQIAEDKLAKAVDKANEALSNSSGIIEARNNMESLYEQYENGKISASEMTDAVNNLYEKLGLTTRVENGTQALKDYVEQAEKATNGQLQVSNADLFSGIESSRKSDDFFTNDNGKSSNSLETGTHVRGAQWWWEAETEQQHNQRASNKKAADALSQAMNGTVFSTEQGKKAINESDYIELTYAKVDPNASTMQIVDDYSEVLSGLQDALVNGTISSEEYTAALGLFQNIFGSVEDIETLVSQEKQYEENMVEIAKSNLKDKIPDNASDEDIAKLVIPTIQELLHDESFKNLYDSTNKEDRGQFVLDTLASIFGEQYRELLAQTIDNFNIDTAKPEWAGNGKLSNKSKLSSYQGDATGNDELNEALLKSPSAMEYIQGTNLSYDKLSLAAKYAQSFGMSMDTFVSNLGENSKTIEDLATTLMDPSNFIGSRMPESVTIADSSFRQQAEAEKAQREKEDRQSKAARYLMARDPSLSLEDAIAEGDRLHDEIFSISSDILTDAKKTEKFWDVVSGRLSESDLLNNINQKTYNVNDMAGASEEAKTAMANAASLLDAQRLGNGQTFDERQEQAGSDVEFLYDMLGEDIINYSDEQLASMAQYAADAMEAGWSPENVQAAILSYLTTGEWETNIVFEDFGEIGQDTDSINAYNLIVDQARKESEQKYGEGHYNDEEVTSEVASVASQLASAKYSITDFVDAINDGFISLDDGIEAALQAFFDLKNGTAQAEQWEKDRIERDAQKRVDTWNPALKGKTQRIMDESGVDEDTARIQAKQEIDDLEDSLDELGLTAEDVIAMGIDLKQSNEAIVEQAQAIQNGSAAGLSVADQIVAGDPAYNASIFANKDDNGFLSESNSLRQKALDLGYNDEQFEKLAKIAQEAGMSVEEFSQYLENVSVGLKSTSAEAKEFFDTLIEGKVSVEEARKVVNGWSDEGLEKLSESGLLSDDNSDSLAKLVGLTNGDETLMLKVIPFLDTENLDASIEEYENNPDNFISLQVTQQVASNNLNDEGTEFTTEIGQALGYTEEFSQAVVDAAGQSNALGDAWGIISTNTYGAQAAVAEYNSELERTDYANQEREIGDLKAELSDTENEIDALQEKADRGIILDVDAKALEEAQDRASELKKQINGKKFELEINVTGDLLDEADSLIEACGDVRDALDRINDDYTTDGTVENLEALVNVFPDILDGATTSADGMVQLNQDVVDSSVAAANGEIEAASSATGAKLDNMIEYAGAMAEMYAEQASTYQTMADSETTTAAEVAEQKKTFDDDMANAAMENQYNIDDATAEALTNEVDNQTTAAQNQIDTSQEGADAAIANLAAVSSQSATSMQDVISNAQAAWAAVASIGKESFSGGTTHSSGVTASSRGGEASKKNITGAKDKKDAPDHSGTTGDKGSGQDLAQKYADDARNRSDSWNRIQGLLQARKASLSAGNADVKSPGSRGNGSGSGSGSGDGSGSSYDPKTKEKLEDEADRYEKVNAQIDKLNNALEQLNTEEARLVGFNRTDVIKKETENIKRQIEVYKQKLELQKQERDETKKKLEDDFKVEFDSEGYISNYQKKFEEYLGGINYLIEQYNNETTEEGQEALEKKIENAQKAFDDFKDLISKYDELNSNTIKETEKNLQDLHDKIEDMITDLFNKAVEAVDTIKEVDDAVVDLKKTFRSFDKEEDDPFLSAEISDNKIASYFDAGTKSAKTFFDTAIARLKKLKDEAKTDEEKTKYQAAIDGLVAGQKLQGQGVLDKNGTGYLDMALQSGQLILQNIKQYNETGKSDLFGENQQAMMEAAKTVFDQLTDMASNLREEIDNLRDSIIDAIDMVADEIEKREDLLDSISNRLDHVSSMSQILHGNTIQGYEEQNKILAVQSQLADQRLAEATQELDYWNKIASTVIKGSKEEEEALEHVREATEKKNEAIENSVNLYKQQVQASANLALAQWQKQWLGTDDMEWAQTQWEMMNRNADYYLDDVNKAYNIQKLQSQYTDLLDGANTLDIQTKITDQMNQQLEYLRTKTNLSEYDVSYAQAQLEILKQQIALEEAQANKSQMKLRRDSQGNYNYVYTANEDNVKSAQDSLLDAQNNAYNLSKDQMKQTQEDSFSAFQQAKQLLLDIWSDTTLGVTEQKERMQAVIDNLVQYLNMTGEQLSTSQTNLLESFYGMVDSLNDENIGSLQEIYDKLQEGSTNAFDSIDTRWNTTITTLLQNKDKFADSMADLQKKMEDSLTKYNTSIEDASKIANEKIGDISDSFNGVKRSIDGLTDSFGTLTSKLQGYIDKIGGYSAKLKEYQTTFDSISQENGELRQTITDLQDEINKMKRQEAQGKNEGGIISTTPSGSSGKGNGKGDGKGDKGFGGSGYSREDLINGIAFAIYNDGWDSGWGNDPVRSSKLIKAYGIDFAKSVQDYINIHIYDDSVFYEDHQKAAKFWSTKLVGYDTGGYTGDWSDGSGKLALLHSKEIVLNASDTQNILKAVESVRAMTAAMKGATLAEAVGSISSIGKSIETANSKVDQNVNITAEFPNATSADEIREAILGLNNQVLHYTHRKA